jgi:glycogen synthase
MTAPRPRIVMATFEYGPIRCGGLAAMLTALCGALDLARFEPVVVLPRSGQAPPWPRIARHALSRGAADVHRDAGCEVWLLDGPLMDEPIYPEPADIAGIKKIDEYGERLAELLGVVRGDLLHLHDAFGYKALHAARKRGLPTLFTVHRLHDDEPPTAFGELAAVRLADEVSTVSAGYARERGDFFAPRERVHVVPNGIDTGFWSEAALAPGDRAGRLRALQHRLDLPPGPTFGCIGRLDADQKGLDVLLDAHAQLGGAPLNLIVAGDGDPGLAVRLAAAAARPGTLRFVHRQLARDEVRGLLAAVDFAVIPSRYEPFGLIQLEAMAMGALPIGSRVGGLGEVIVELELERERDDGFGRLFEAGDPAQLAAAMRQLAELARRDPAALPELRRRARARAGRYSARAMAERYEALYLAMLERAAGPGLRHAG